DVVGRAEAPDGLSRERRAVEHAVRALGLDGRGRDRVRARAERADRARERLGERDEAALRRGVRDRRGPRADETDDARDVQDRVALPLPLELARRGLRAEERSAK